MKKLRIFLAMVPFLLASLAGKAQMSDLPAYGQRILQLAEMAKQLKTASDVYTQNKEWFDGLRQVSGVIQHYRKVKQTMELTRDIAKIYTDNMGRFRADKNLTLEEIIAIQEGYIKLLKESAELLDDLVLGATGSGMKLTDKERYDIINDVYKQVKEHKELVEYYTQKQINVSYMRAKAKGETARLLRHYGLSQ